MSARKTPTQYITEINIGASNKLDAGKLKVYRTGLEEANLYFSENELRFVIEYLCEKIIDLEGKLCPPGEG